MMMGLEKILRGFTRVALASTILYSTISCSGGSDSRSPGPTGPSNPPAQTPTNPPTSTPTPPTPQNTPRLSSNTVVLDQTTLNSISSYSNGTFNFSGSPSQISSLSVGKIIAGGISQATPYGFLRKVTSISNGRTIGTQQATLAEAVEQGSISFRKRLTPSGFSSYLRNGPAFSSTANQVGFDFGTTFDKVLSDADGNPLTTNDQFRIKGRANFNYELNFDLVIGAPLRLDRFLLENTVTQESEINASGAVPFTFFSKDITVLEFPLPPQMYTIPTAPPLPFVIAPTIKIKVGVEGTTYPQVTANLIHKSSLNAGTKYENGSWTKFSTPTNEFNFSPLPTLVPSNTYSEITANVGPELELLVDGVLGPTIGIEGYLKLNSDYAGRSYLELKAGLRVPVGIRAEIFGFTFLDRQETILDFSKFLGQWTLSSQNPNPPTTPTTPTTRVDTLYSIKDAYVRWSNLTTTTANTNFNSNVLKLKRDEGRSYEETLIMFSLQSLPPNITVNSANLSLYGFCAGNVSGPTNFSVVKNLQNWAETQVTWNSKPGRSNSSYGGISIPQGNGTKRRDITITSLTKEWLANRDQNYGLTMIAAEDLADCTINSKEHLDSTTRPRLIVTYTKP